MLNRVLDQIAYDLLHPGLVHQDRWVPEIQVTNQVQLEFQLLNLDFEDVQHWRNDLLEQLVRPEVRLELVYACKAEVEVRFDLLKYHLIALPDNLNVIQVEVLFCLDCLQDLVCAFQGRQHIVSQRLSHQLNSVVFCPELDVLAHLGQILKMNQCALLALKGQLVGPNSEKHELGALSLCAIELMPDFSESIFDRGNVRLYQVIE